jgi:REP element-mobilizing transposase RayT
LPYQTRRKTGRTSPKVRATKSRRNFLHERTQFTTLDPKLMFWCVSYYLCAFGTISLPYETRCKMGELVQKFEPRSRVGIFHNECIRSTLLHRKLTFWCVSYYLCSFGTVWLPYETQCKTGRASAKVRATKSRRNFSQRTHPIHPIGP